MINIKKAFTLTELVVVVAIIGILMMGLTVYLGGLGERTKIIEGQGCSTSLWGELNNYVFYALTNKNLRTGNTVISPDFYYIQLTGGTSNNSNNCTVSNYTGNNPIFCNELVVGYKLESDSSRQTYDTFTPQNTCQQNQVRLGFYRSGANDDIKFVKMNKGFAPIGSDNDIFILGGDGSDFPLLEGDIIIVLCTSDNCYGGKEIAKLDVDARIQKIYLKKCIFYKDDNPAKCDSREN